jgi:hypothetical protein
MLYTYKVPFTLISSSRKELTLKSTLLFAYLDPGTGSIVAQSIIGVIAGIGLFGRRLFTGIITKIKSLFGGAKKD